MSWPGSDNTKAGYNSAAMSHQCSSAATSPKWLHSVLPCLSIVTVQPRLQSGCSQCCHVLALQQYNHVSKVQQCNHDSAMQPRLGISR